ncbi:MAG: serine/threonine-protein phosphatase [Rothia sp.]|jgi:serine/threonine phosphatase|uniref:PP2C family protein-serine/threonine phosphatase n=1 Tax=Rothia sp. (in: high G+C Gram-positive bacteria) TaxID=1885016 RepID=UPI001CB31681|nr:protein phosphatase 2C domain-containing protein [Rothia sp. (in: high G+C Gram-positive bacteria)]MBF1677031.1 serine/threonine-protein phosphatase [Rothia sp. (in: high G+C Gram-positive bacteria)]
MKIAFRLEARSDTGLKRSKNDDSGYGGRYLAVVADGMGGHVGGDVASATTVLNLTPLDHPDFENGTGGVYLADEIQSANLIINELAANDPQLAGMGTTCTALLIDGDCIEFAHIGDSRAYRLRPGADGEFEQISTDHTFVQRLLNEGRITPEEAEHHPHKNVIMRVLGDVDASPELELKTLDAVVGERWVLSSDGLDAVVSVPEIEQVMRSHDDLAEVADTLISMTLERGAPDNVTVVALQVIDREELPVDEPVGPSALPDSALPDSIAAEQEVSVNTQKLPEIAATAEAAEATLAALEQESAHHNVRRFRRARDFAGTLLHSGSDAVRHHIGTYDNAVDAALTNAAILRGELGSRPHQLVGAAAVATETGMIPAVTSRTLEHRATVAQRMPLTVDEAPLPAELEELIAEEPAERTSRRSWSVRLFIFLLVAALLTLAAWTGLRYVERSYYVGESDGTVAVYNGIPQALGPIRLSHVVENTDISTSQLSDHTRTLLRNSITAKDLNEAHQIVSRLKTQAEQNRIKAEQAASASASPTPDPTATASLAPEPAESGAETPTESPSTEGGENHG